ncbi:AraC family ligand binding domain-containing protein [Paraburkholderia kirstenboschensis]|uniref:AraC family ligand binding domain-containing protein n=1 Tax=Paraburkholderia kirstenboschensis TaxID=1245436 RepID=UPI000FFBAFDA
MRADFTTQQYAPHTHEGFVIAITESGGSVVRSRGVNDEVRTSTLLVFNPAEAHSGWMGSSERWRLPWIGLKMSVVSSCRNTPETMKRVGCRTCQPICAAHSLAAAGIAARKLKPATRKPTIQALIAETFVEEHVLMDGLTSSEGCAINTSVSAAWTPKREALQRGGGWHF